MGACVGLKRSLAVLPPHLGIEVMRGGALSSGIVLFVKVTVCMYVPAGSYASRSWVCTPLGADIVVLMMWYAPVKKKT